MSLSLNLIVYQYDSSRLITKSSTQMLGQTVLPFDGNLSELQSAIRPLSLELSDGLLIFDEEEGLIPTDTDSLGDPLQFMYNFVLLPYLKLYGKGAWSNAAIAFLEALSDETRVVLYWR